MLSHSPPGSGVWVETRHVAYTYYRTGHASNITIKDAVDPTYRDLALYYDVQGRLVVALWDEWERDGSGDPVNDQRIKAREFRYDNTDARQRYMLREIDPAALPTIVPLTSTAGQWVEYDGTSGGPYADGEYTHASAGSHSVTRTYDPMSETDVVSGDELNLHGDLIGSTVATTDANESNIARQAYTAFGEPVSGGTGFQPVSSRYRYAGAWGYEADLLSLDGAPGTTPIALLHLGERWYDPALGRFIQRDPIGLAAGANCYVYLSNNPLITVDASGMIAPWLAGGLIGGGIGAGIGGFRAWLNGDSIIHGVVSGGVSGAVAGATFGLLGPTSAAGGIAAGALGGALGAAGGNVAGNATRMCMGLQPNWSGFGQDVFLGALFGGLLGGLSGAGDGAGASVPGLFPAVFESFQFAVNQGIRWL